MPPVFCEHMLIQSFLKNRLKDLLLLLKSSPFVDMKSIIVYCKFQVISFLFPQDVHTFVQYLNLSDTAAKI